MKNFRKGMAHLNGLGTKSDIRTAVKYLQLAAQNQNIRAILKLADMQAGGRGIPRSCQGYFFTKLTLINTKFLISN